MESGSDNVDMALKRRTKAMLGQDLAVAETLISRQADAASHGGAEQASSGVRPSLGQVAIYAVSPPAQRGKLLCLATVIYWACLWW